jgi:hypothetical protein
VKKNNNRGILIDERDNGDKLSNERFKDGMKYQNYDEKHEAKTQDSSWIISVLGDGSNRSALGES